MAALPDRNLMILFRFIIHCLSVLENWQKHINVRHYNDIEKLFHILQVWSSFLCIYNTPIILNEHHTRSSAMTAFMTL